MSSTPVDAATLTGPILSLPEQEAPCLSVYVHDASRLAWSATVPIPEVGRAPYELELELDFPDNVLGSLDPWAVLQSYVRLDDQGDEEVPREPPLEAFRRRVVAVSNNIARARDGFARHCTLIRSSTNLAEAPLGEWVSIAAGELRKARSVVLSAAGVGSEVTAADEFLSSQLWIALTDCERALLDLRKALDERGELPAAALDRAEGELANSLKEELGYRRARGFTVTEPTNTAELERLLTRTAWLKRHFEQALFLDVESYEVVRRLAGWFSAAAAMLAYLWFLLWQLTLERHLATVGSGLVAFVLITAAAYASRERLKEIGRSWLAGRVQRAFAQRITRCWLPTRPRRRGTLVVSARESFSQSTSRRPDFIHPDCGAERDMTVLRFTNRGFIANPPARAPDSARQIRFIYRLDLSSLFPRLHNAVRGLASLDDGTGRLAIRDVPRNSAVAVRARLRWAGGSTQTSVTLLLNKNGLVRVEEEKMTAESGSSPI